MSEIDYMQLAIDAAKAAAEHGEVPVGAVLVGPKGEVLAVAQNQMRRQKDATAHAEIVAIRQACAKLGKERLLECDLYVTLEPCPMCAGAIAHARLRRLYYGAGDIKGGAVDHGVALFAQDTCHHAPEVIGGLREGECADLLTAFFALRRNEPS